MKQWFRRLAYCVDGLAVVYWLGFYLYLALCEPTENSGSVLGILYAVWPSVWGAAFWMVARVRYYARLPMRSKWKMLLMVAFETQAIVQVLFLALLTMMSFSDGGSWREVGEWLLSSSWLPAGLLVMFLDCKLNLFSTNVA